MNQVIELGNIVDTGNWKSPQRGRIYSVDGICPTLNTVGGGNLQPKVIVKVGEKYGWNLTRKNRNA